MKTLAAATLLAAVAVAAGCGGGSPDTVGTDQIEDGAVVTRKLADGAVTAEKLAERSVAERALAEAAVTLTAIAPDAVDAERVIDDSLTGDEIDEATLEGVDAATLNGSASFIRDVQAATQTSSINTNDRKGPVTATCPEGTEVVAGGASIVTASGRKVPVALTASTSNAGNGWNAEAIEVQPVNEGWGLRVVALCGVLSG